MHNTEQLPLDFHLYPAAQTEAFQADAAGDMTAEMLELLGIDVKVGL
jgi:hypothetical protein